MPVFLDTSASCLISAMEPGSDCLSAPNFWQAAQFSEYIRNFLAIHRFYNIKVYRNLLPGHRGRDPVPQDPLRNCPSHRTQLPLVLAPQWHVNSEQQPNVVVKLHLHVSPAPRCSATASREAVTGRAPTKIRIASQTTTSTRYQSQSQQSRLRLRRSLLRLSYAHHTTVLRTKTSTSVSSLLHRRACECGPAGCENQRGHGGHGSSQYSDGQCTECSIDGQWRCNVVLGHQQHVRCETEVERRVGCRWDWKRRDAGGGRIRGVDGYGSIEERFEGEEQG